MIDRIAKLDLTYIVNINIRNHSFIQRLTLQHVLILRLASTLESTSTKLKLSTQRFYQKNPGYSKRSCVDPLFVIIKLTEIKYKYYENSSQVI